MVERYSLALELAEELDSWVGEKYIELGRASWPADG
jgi:hypothetical protein